MSSGDSKIDWKKPVQITGSQDGPPRPARVLYEDSGNRLIEWQTECHGAAVAMVSEYGKLIATLHSGAAMPGTTQFVENVPEKVVPPKPKDTLVMFLSREEADLRGEAIAALARQACAA